MAQQWPTKWPQRGVPLEGAEKTPQTPFGARLRALRKQRGWSQALLGARADMAQQQVQKLERQGVRPSMYVVTRLCEALNVPIESLTGTHIVVTDPSRWRDLTSALDEAQQALTRLRGILESLGDVAAR